ncbi:MAG: TRAP transporter small permease [Candidatus Accumulibacter sp.]|jgi:TRAP-type C4-dicarboxylate transport system permease small subunit|nr:TRAP transporter small permease [Accumulibacter sp.]
MKHKFLVFERWLSAVIIRVACVLLAIVSALGFTQVFTRFVVNHPLTWSEVLIRLLIIWMVMLGAVIAFREGAQISLDFMFRKSGRFQRSLHLAISVVCVVYLGALIWFGCDLAWRTRFQEIGSMEFLPMSVGYAAIPVGAFFSIIAVVANFLDPRRNELETQQ